MAVATEVAFHFNVGDKGQYLCRLLRKVHQAQLRALVCVEPALAQELDTLLWSFSQEDFLPHALLSDEERLRAHSPLWIAAGPGDWAEAQVLVNGLPDMPQRLEGYQRVVEIVGTSDEDRQAARVRWKTYKELGYTLQQYDVTGVAAAPVRGGRS